jgi:sugar O-acyltransferase (sialic acid O-acetyltransferase NeuD family)
MSNSDPSRVLVLGTGSQAKIVIDLLEDVGAYELVGCISGDPNAPAMVSGYPVLGDWESMPRIRSDGVTHAAVGVGGWTGNDLRKDVYERARRAGFEIVTAIHPASIISRSATVGEGSVIMASATIQNHVTVGRNNVMFGNSIIGHEAVLKDHVLISGGVTVGGCTVIGEGAVLAIGSTVVSNMKIGENVFVAPGAVVTNDIPSNTRVYGVPARER